MSVGPNDYRTATAQMSTGVYIYMFFFCDTSLSLSDYQCIYIYIYGVRGMGGALTCFFVFLASLTSQMATDPSIPTPRHSGG